MVCEKGFVSVLCRKANPILICREKNVLTSVRTFSNPEIYIPVWGRLPTLGLRTRWKEAGHQHPWGGYWVWGGDDILPQSLGHMEGGPDVTEILRDYPTPVQKSALIKNFSTGTQNVAYQRSPVRALTMSRTPLRVPQRGQCAGGPAGTQKTRTHSQGWTQGAHKPKSARFLAQNNSQVILAEVISKIYFKTIALVWISASRMGRPREAKGCRFSKLKSHLIEETGQKS